MNSNFEHVKKVDDCIDTATMDACDIEEAISGWLCCIEEIFEGVDTAFLLGEEVGIEKIDILNNSTLVAVCKKNHKKTKIPLTSLEFKKLSKVQKLWFKAWIK